MYNYNHLYYFYVTVKSKSITAAARSLKISQPSLSTQLKVLEDFLQVKLFQKSGRGKQLTSEGTVIFGFCRQMFELSEEMHESISEKIPYASRRIYIGISHEVANSFVVEVVSHFLEQYSKELRPKIMMISGSHERLTEKLRLQQIDLIFSQQAMISLEFKNIQQVKVPVNLISSTEIKPLKKSKQMSALETIEKLSFKKIPQWVMPLTGFKLRSEIDGFLEAHSLNGRIVFESDVIESLTRAIVDYIGIAFLPLIYVPKEIKNKSLFCYGPKEGYWKYQVWLSCHIKSQDDPFIKEFSNSFRAVCRPLISKKLPLRR